VTCCALLARSIYKYLLNVCNQYACQCVILNANKLRIAYYKYSAYVCRVFSVISHDTMGVMVNTVLVLPNEANKVLILFGTSRTKFLAGSSTALGDFRLKQNRRRYFLLYHVFCASSYNNYVMVRSPSYQFIFKFLYWFRSPAHKLKSTWRSLKNKKPDVNMVDAFFSISDLINLRYESRNLHLT
jgi:hypothetical protein